MPISAINLGEVYYVIARYLGRDRALASIETLSATVLEVNVPDQNMITRAADLKISGGISYADCFAAALALERNLAVLTNDGEFERLLPFGLQIEWLT